MTLPLHMFIVLEVPSADDRPLGMALYPAFCELCHLKMSQELCQAWGALSPQHVPSRISSYRPLNTRVQWSQDVDILALACKCVAAVRVQNDAAPAYICAL
jgi:hypothetical protein